MWSYLIPVRQPSSLVWIKAAHCRMILTDSLSRSKGDGGLGLFTLPEKVKNQQYRMKREEVWFSLSYRLFVPCALQHSNPRRIHCPLWVSYLPSANMPLPDDLSWTHCSFLTLSPCSSPRQGLSPLPLTATHAAGHILLLECSFWLFHIKFLSCHSDAPTGSLG